MQLKTSYATQSQKTKNHTIQSFNSGAKEKEMKLYYKIIKSKIEKKKKRLFNILIGFTLLIIVSLSVLMFNFE